ncbi:hypothetical protein BO71DRAFT_486723 [Aspergillus ellipticus CBS 707.79]|uniref:Uncharacterized protein n=1 Tax=Aspergillus ellipticus CBS 707.79 TaxID=1448320 RepID=A0A319D083_9EURO|nr:hypothetical protein BO71DRAFT_486723 [Aspergillus ellipticus CBS 707.79]
MNDIAPELASPERAALIQRLVKAAEHRITAESALITLSKDVRWLWDRARFALQPLRVSEDRRSLDVRV